MKIAEARPAEVRRLRHREQQFGYCADDNTIYYSKDFATAAYDSLTAIDPQKGTGNIRLVQDLPADYSLGVLFAIGFGLAARHQFFSGSLDDGKALTAAVCYAGAYTADVNPATNPDLQNDKTRSSSCPRRTWTRRRRPSSPSWPDRRRSARAAPPG